MAEEIAFSARNRHNAAVSLIPAEAREGDHRYRAYYENQHGEQLIFVYDRKTGRGVLYHGDVDWEPREVTEETGVMKADIILDVFEREWLSICWRTATALIRRLPKSATGDADRGAVR
ncbi:MAG: hypothetical protein JOZ41_08375 [Chloroflexi bacterium]|nr:hypothetical protein [Chloroflexota bacterium]